MTINLDGILFKVWSTGVVMFLLGLFLLIFGGKKYRRISLITMLFYVLYAGYYLWVYANPEIVTCEGRFKSEHQRRRAAPAYVFYLDLTTPETFYLDSHTRKEVIPFELEKGMLYRIGYEARSNIIVAIEPIQ